MAYCVSCGKELSREESHGLDWFGEIYCHKCEKRRQNTLWRRLTAVFRTGRKCYRREGEKVKDYSRPDWESDLEKLEREFDAEKRMLKCAFWFVFGINSALAALAVSILIYLLKFILRGLVGA